MALFYRFLSIVVLCMILLETCGWAKSRSRRTGFAEKSGAVSLAASLAASLVAKNTVVSFAPLPKKVKLPIQPLWVWI